MPDAPTAAPAVPPVEAWAVLFNGAIVPNAVYGQRLQAEMRRAMLTHPERYRVVQVEIRAREDGNEAC